MEPVMIVTLVCRPEDMRCLEMGWAVQARVDEAIMNLQGVRDVVHC